LRVWNAALGINTEGQPNKMALLSGDPNANPKTLKQQDQQRIAVTMDIDPVLLDNLRLPGGPYPEYAGEGDPPWFGNGDRGHEGADPNARPFVPTNIPTPVAQPPDPQSGTLAEVVRPLPKEIYLKGNGEANVRGGKQVGKVRIRWYERYQQANEVVAYWLGRLLGVNIPYSELGPRASDGATVNVMRWVEGTKEEADAVRLAYKGLDTNGQPLKLTMPLEQHQARMREEYSGSRLLDALLGGFDSKGNNFAVTRDAHLVRVDLDRAEPFDAELTIEHIAEQMKKRFEGDGYPKEGIKTDRYRKLDDHVGVTYDEIAKVWESMKTKLLDPKGNLNEQKLAEIAQAYGEHQRKVLETWKHRIRSLDTVLGRVFLPQERLAALDMSEAEFRASDSKKVKEPLFRAAQWMRAAQQSLAQGILAELGLPPDAAYTILKRDTIEAFTDGVLGKMHRNKYDKVLRMDDMARGRFNLATGADVKRVVEALEKQDLFKVKNDKPGQQGKAEGPKEREKVEMGYPRYHAIMKDPVTGLTFEWQIGTKRTTEFFELPGIELGKLTLKEGMTPNIHDIEYDIFKYLQESDKPGYADLAKELGIPEYRKKVAQYAAKTFEGNTVPEAEFRQSLAEFHKEASTILANLIERKGVEFVQDFFH
jgi:hypothetical protein